MYPNRARADDDGQRVHWRDLETGCIPLYAYLDRSLPSVSDLLGNLDKRSPAAAEYAKLWWQHRYGSPESPRTLWSLPKARTFATLGVWATKLIDEPWSLGQLVLTLFAGEEPRRHVVFTEEGAFAVHEETT